MMETLVDRAGFGSGDSDPEVGSGWHPPASKFEAISRGIRNRCPKCGSARFFPRFLKPIECCPVCKKDWTPHRADDFPAYLSILITGHLMAPVIILLAGSGSLPLWATVAIIISLVLLLSVALLQPSKGAVMALLWCWGVNGTQPDAPGEAVDEEN